MYLTKPRNAKQQILFWFGNELSQSSKSVSDILISKKVILNIIRLLKTKTTFWQLSRESLGFKLVHSDLIKSIIWRVWTLKYVRYNLRTFIRGRIFFIKFMWHNLQVFSLIFCLPLVELSNARQSLYFIPISFFTCSFLFVTHTYVPQKPDFVTDPRK